MSDATFIRIDPALHRKLKSLAAAQGFSITEAAEQAIKTWNYENERQPRALTLEEESTRNEQVRLFVEYINDRDSFNAAEITALFGKHGFVLQDRTWNQVLRPIFQGLHFVEDGAAHQLVRYCR